MVCVCGVNLGEETLVVLWVGFYATLLRPVVSVFYLKVIWDYVEAGKCCF